MESDQIPFLSPPPNQELCLWNPPGLSSDQEIDAALLDPSISADQVLRLPGIVQQFQHGNSRLVSLLTSPENLNEIISIVQNSESRELSMTAFQLFMLPNSALLKSFSQNFEYIEASISILTKCDAGQSDEKKYCYAVGIISQIILKALKAAPADFLSVLKQSPNFFSYVLSFVEVESIFYMIMNIVQTRPAWFHTYLWGFLTAYIGERTKMVDPPKSWDISIISIENAAKVRLRGSESKARLLNIFTKFIQTFDGEQFQKEFRSSIGKLFPFIISTSFELNERLALFDLGKKLPPSSKLTELALYIIDDKIINTELTQKAIEYLTFAFNGERIEPIANFLFRILNTDSFFPKNQNTTNNFIIQATVDLTKKMMQICQHPRFFAKIVQHCIACCWNNSNFNSQIMYRSACLSIGSVVGDMPSWNGWITFYDTVIALFHQKLPFDRTVKIDTTNWDKDLVDKLRTHSSNIPMSIDDFRPLFEVFIDEESDESRSAESGSYALNISGDSSDSEPPTNPIPPVPQYQYKRNSSEHENIPSFNTAQPSNSRRRSRQSNISPLYEDKTPRFTKKRSNSLIIEQKQNITKKKKDSGDIDEKKCIIE